MLVKTTPLHDFSSDGREHPALPCAEGDQMWISFNLDVRKVATVPPYDCHVQKSPTVAVGTTEASRLYMRLSLRR
jgi:hypothetical protein